MEQFDALDHLKGTLIDTGIRFGPKLAVALLIVVLGHFVARSAARLANAWFSRLGIDVSVARLMVRVVHLLVLSLFFMLSLQNLGVDLLPLVAGLGVAGAGVALALQGVLGNLAAGLTIIFTRPFKVGDYIEVVGVEGLVDSVELFTTRLLHADRSVVVVPNRKIAGEILHNYGALRQLDLSVSLARAEDAERALGVLQAVLAEEPLVLKDPAPVLGIAKLGETAVTVAVRPWVQAGTGVAASGAINQAALRRLQAEGVALPPSERRVKVLQG